MEFTAAVLLSGTTATGIEVPPAVVDGLGGGRGAAVRVTINGYSYRSTVAPMGGKFMLPISAEHRDGAHVGAGDAVSVELTLDTAPRTLAIPPDLQRALDADGAARRSFDALSFSRKQRFTIPVEQAKTAETRLRRIEKTLNDLRAGRG
jgi:hypothetical protein